MTKRITLYPIIDLSAYISGYTIISSSLGPHLETYVLLCDAEPQRIDGMFVQSVTRKLHTYKILKIEQDNIYEITLYKQKYNYHFAQPVGNDHIIIVGARTRYFSKDQFELNGKIFDFDGVCTSELLLGDGIQSIQATKTGTLWTGYFDEGVFGNNGWDSPIGAAGLIAWDSEGKRIYENKNFGICDCYALNVVSEDEIWFYYYTDFQLVRLFKHEPDIFKPNISGSNGFLVFNNYFLFDKGYGKHNKYKLLKMNTNGHFKQLGEITFVNEQGATFDRVDRDFRGDTLLLRDNHLLYQVTLKEIINELL